MFEIRSDQFREAVRTIQKRAERQQFEEKLTQTFVPTRVIDELQTDQNQLVFGRRGVGKTHTLKVYLGKKIVDGNLCTYIDCTSFGSGLASEGTAKNLGIRFFAKLIHHLSYNLLDDVARMEQPDTKQVDRLTDVLGALAELAAPSEQGETFKYSEIVRLTNAFMDTAGVNRLYIIIDEWAQIPIQAQPFFGEFLKRAFFSNPRVTVKVGVVDYTYRLSERYSDNIIGLEKAADIFSDIRMDRHFVWDEDHKFVERFFATLLYNHLTLALGGALSLSAPDSEKDTTTRRELFTQDKAFSELCRASEGNARDFMVIFSRAHADFCKQTQRERIGLPDIQRAAGNWYREDKLANIASETGLGEFLKYLVEEVISNKKARTFMVPAKSVSHPLLQRLFAARVLHPLNTEWSHPDRPGERYSLVTIDYGTYASFKGTRNEPQGWLFTTADQENPDDLVPLDDRRSIRRIVVDAETMDKYVPPPAVITRADSTRAFHDCS